MILKTAVLEHPQGWNMNNPKFIPRRSSQVTLMNCLLQVLWAFDRSHLAELKPNKANWANKWKYTGIISKNKEKGRWSAFTHFGGLTDFLKRLKYTALFYCLRSWHMPPAHPGACSRVNREETHSGISTGFIGQVGTSLISKIRWEHGCSSNLKFKLHF